MNQREPNKILVPPAGLEIPQHVKDEIDKEEEQLRVHAEKARILEERRLTARAAGRRDDVRQGICRGTRTSSRGVVYQCARRTTIWMPAGLCEKCLQAAIAGLTAEDEE